MRHLATLALIACFAAAAQADEVHLKDGKVLEGKVIEDGDRILVVDRDRTHAVKKTELAKPVVKKKCFMDEYQERLADLPAEDAEAIYEFGRWLEKNDWGSRARRAYEEVLELDPDHRAARRALGYRLYEGEWVSPTELNRRKGLVEFEGRWYTKHDLARLKQEIERNAKLREAIAQRRRVNGKINEIVKDMAKLDKKARKKAHDRLYTLAERLDSPEIRKFADDALAYYDYLHKVYCSQFRARTEIHATHTQLKKPIDTFNTTLGQSIAFLAGQQPVTIQLPEISIAEVHTTVDIPAGCK